MRQEVVANEEAEEDEIVNQPLEVEATRGGEVSLLEHIIA